MNRRTKVSYVIELLQKVHGLYVDSRITMIYVDKEKFGVNLWRFEVDIHDDTISTDELEAFLDLRKNS